MERTLTVETTKKARGVVSVSGWVDSRRDHGKIIFIDLRDRSGLLQIVFIPKDKELYERANALRPEWVIQVEGKIGERPNGMENPELPTGSIEMLAEKLVVLNEAKGPPFPIDTAGGDIEESMRLEYRYLDLRRQRMQKNIRARSDINLFFRNHLAQKGFVEIETPILTKGTPEGAREFIVPSRLFAGKFYVLPQSPQQFKQLLMVGGFERYFQIARCFRDEDQRGDRQPEFTQLDMEMSFVEREDVMRLNEGLLIDTIRQLYPKKIIQETPFPRISYAEATEKYGSDRPDLRKDKNDPNLLAFCWIVDFPFFEKMDAAHPETPAQEWTFTHNPFSAPKPEHAAWHLAGERIGDILTTQYDIVLNGTEIGGGSIRAHTPEMLKATFRIMGFSDERIERDFGHMLIALSHGAPPHGGIAWGLDRFIMILENENSIQEVIAFPKTGNARDPLMGSPSEIDPKQLKDLHIKIIE
ncbi:MAG: hypothetical protein A2934_01195 [Candidatus Sungbacteria bacterium RIFCSPLOWO2_01_FULL_47_10]|uniref:Aspartate--tRNA(Asp/Asn) ligase n=1 Tax=Candidatus Sungbacteria bacterium RIFCSPLOWO2_01_FULL_47_10 TaxID=1802276 RepID=A0A1G2L3X8_9BACT|nr:MAG: hypothetical protein A2934_01195 [Candidatus Sungbacteria bacterium RIFCSPLOWO2_01_FULL_47_10]